jgi:hypothetical protein
MGLERYVVDACSSRNAARPKSPSPRHLPELAVRADRPSSRCGYAVLEPRSRRPRSCPRKVGEQVVATVLHPRQELVAAPKRMLARP